MKWAVERAKDYDITQPWLVACNCLPNTAVNQLEMWQADTYGPETIDIEPRWAKWFGSNSLQFYLHDLVQSHDSSGYAERIDYFLGIAERFTGYPLIWQNKQQ